MELWQLCIIWYVVFVFSVVFHEFAHAFVAYHFGDHTAAHHGLATLDPIPHIQRSPFGMVVVPLLSFVGAGWMIGWASTPYDPYWAQHHPKEAALKTLAGPGANLILVIVAGILIYIGLLTGVFIPPQDFDFTAIVDGRAEGFQQGLAVLLSVLFTLNLLLLVFNLIPVAPLDGTALMEFILKGELLWKYRTLMAHPTVRMFGIFIAWYLIRYIFWPVYTAAVYLLYFFYHASTG